MNLSSMGIVTVIIQFAFLSVYYYNKGVFITYNTYFDIVEISIMTILYEAILLISTDRLACVLLKVRYKRYITEPLVKRVVVFSWIIGIVSGPIMIPLVVTDEYSKTYYFMTFDVLVLLLVLITYINITVVLLGSDRRFPQRSKHGGRIIILRKIFLIPSLVVTSFVLFNVVPDFVILKVNNDISHNIIACLWEISFISDPLIYIYFNEKSKQIAISSLKTMINCFLKCCNRRRQTAKQNNAVSNTNTQMVTYNKLFQHVVIKENGECFC